MKRKHDIDTNTNQDGCKAVIPEDYSRQKAAKIQEHETDSTLITKQKVKPILIGGVSVMDGAVILSILKSALLQEPALSFIMSFGVALVVNILPVFIAKFCTSGNLSVQKICKGNGNCIYSSIPDRLWIYRDAQVRI